MVISYEQINKNYAGSSDNNHSSERPRAFLIRVGMDSTYGGFVSPIFPDKSFVFIPIPNVRDWGYQLDQPYDGAKTYSQLTTDSGEPLSDYLPCDKIKVVNRALENPANLPVHNDPEFITNTYGEKKEKRVIYSKVRNFKKGDYIIFYGTFFPSPFGFKYKDYKLSELIRMQQKKKQFYIFAYLELKYPPIDQTDYIQYEREIQNNAHYLRGDFKIHDNSFILKGIKDCGLIKPIRIDDGTIIRGNYYMKPEIAQYKLENKQSRGLNRCYCELDSNISNLIIKEAYPV